MKNFNKIVNFLQKNAIFFSENQLLSQKTSIKIGGKCKIFAIPNSQKKLTNLLKFLEGLHQKYIILGNGTNTLFSDEGFDGIVVSTKEIKTLRFFDNNVFAGAGISIFSLLKTLQKKCLSGLEFCYGIPGSVGGAVLMNAGAFNQNFGDFVDYVKVYQNGKIKKVSKSKMKFSYRESLAQKENLVILGVKLKLNFGDAMQIKNLQESYFERRLNSQPYSDLSFGSIFKRNLSFEPVSKLIDDLGLKGYRIGDAEISKKHSGFIINIGSATCQDCLKLIKYIQQKIFDNYGFIPEPEVKLLGDIDADFWGLSHTHKI